MSDQTNNGYDQILGTIVGDYRINAVVGVGGMSRVYDAKEIHSGQQVALKLMSQQYADDDEVKQRFQREARALGKLQHDNIVRFYGSGVVHFTLAYSYYIAMQFINGRTLLAHMKKLREKGTFMEPERIVNILGDIASALDYAHKHGVIHRDIKPGNIMIEESTGRAFLTDFGLMMQSESASTQGTAFGTPRYISPEQAVSSNKAGPQSDIYSLGVVLYELLTGKAPFENDAPMSLAMSHIMTPPPSPRFFRDSISPEVEKVVLKTLEKKPEDRYQTATEMVTAVRVAMGFPAKRTSTKNLKPVVSATSTVPVQATKPPIVTPRSGPPSTTYAPKSEQLTTSLPSRNKAGLLPFALFAIPLAIAAIALLILALDPVQRPAASPHSLASLPPTSQQQVRMVYGPDTLTLYNASQAPVTLAGIVLSQGIVQFPLIDPANPKSGDGLQLDPGECTMIRFKPKVTPTPSGAGAPVAAIATVGPPLFCGRGKVPTTVVNEDRYFWAPGVIDATFKVQRDGTDTPLQICHTALNTCEFSLPKQ